MAQPDSSKRERESEWTHEQFARYVRLVGGSHTFAQMTENMQPRDAAHFRAWIDGTCCEVGS